MRILPLSMALASSPLFATPSLAQAVQAGNSGWGNMMGGGAMMLIFGAAVLFLLFVFARSVSALHHGLHHAPRTAIEILKERFARGEIDRTEFEERRRVLLG